MPDLPGGAKVLVMMPDNGRGDYEADGVASEPMQLEEVINVTPTKHIP